MQCTACASDDRRLCEREEGTEVCKACYNRGRRNCDYGAKYDAQQQAQAQQEADESSDAVRTFPAVSFGCGDTLDNPIPQPPGGLLKVLPVYRGLFTTNSSKSHSDSTLLLGFDIGAGTSSID